VSDSIVPGELMPDETGLTINEGRETTEVTVANTGDRPIQVGSHFHFFEANAALEFDREAAYGMRLDIPAGTAIRFEPGTERMVDLVALAGDRIVSGMNSLVDGRLDQQRDAALERAREQEFGGV
jgi:urease subunit beta